MLDVVKIPTTALFVGPPGVGKSHEVLRLLENEYLHHFENVFFICPTITINETYMNKPWIWKDTGVYTIKSCRNNLLQWIDKLSKASIGETSLFILDDCIADEGFDKNRGALVELAISVRHRGHTLFLLTQSYLGIPKRYRRYAAMIFIWFLKDKEDANRVAKENSFIENWTEIFDKLRESPSKHTFAYIRGEKPFSVVIKND